MERRKFIGSAAILSAGILANNRIFSREKPFPQVRPELSKRKFKSKAIEKAISEFKSNVKNKELGWLFENCFPDTLDTTVSYSLVGNQPDTYVITGDIDAMWLRDSSAQVWPYLTFIKTDPELKSLIAGVIYRQSICIQRDPYANAFYKDGSKISEWKSDLTDMKPGIHERKWEVDSLCFPIRLAHRYWKLTSDTKPFGDSWKKAIQLTMQTFREQQRKNGKGPYSFQRTTAFSTDSVPMSGFGYPARPNGLICSAFRPSDDATVYSYLIPSNFFAVTSLKQAAEMVSQISKDETLATDLKALASEVESALQQYAILDHPAYGKIYAYEINGFGSYNIMDDTNVPSLLSMPYLEAVPNTDPVYINTRKFVLSENNPFFFKGKAGEGVGGPHVGLDMIWPMSMMVRGLTSIDDQEIKTCINTLMSTHAGTGFMHESFHKDDPSKFTRKWFAWANTLFGEFIWKVYKEKPNLLAEL